jgi:hypothetical protein
MLFGALIIIPMCKCDSIYGLQFVCMFYTINKNYHEMHCLHCHLKTLFLAEIIFLLQI